MMPRWFWLALAAMVALAAVVFWLQPARAGEPTLPSRAQGAALIRAQGYPCDRITRLRRRGNVVRVECGPVAYRVTLSPLSLQRW